MKKTTTLEGAAAAAGSAPMWRCKVTLAGAGKIYGTNKHKRGKGAVVELTEEEAKAAESQGWITREGVFTPPAAAEAAPAATDA